MFRFPMTRYLSSCDLRLGFISSGLCSLIFGAGGKKISWEAVLVFGDEKSTAPGWSLSLWHCCCHPFLFFVGTPPSPSLPSFRWRHAVDRANFFFDLGSSRFPGPSRLTRTGQATQLLISYRWHSLRGSSWPREESSWFLKLRIPVQVMPFKFTVLHTYNK